MTNASTCFLLARAVIALFLLNILPTMAIAQTGSDVSSIEQALSHAEVTARQLAEEKQALLADIEGLRIELADKERDLIIANGALEKARAQANSDPSADNHQAVDLLTRSHTLAESAVRRRQLKMDRYSRKFEQLLASEQSNRDQQARLQQQLTRAKERAKAAQAEALSVNTSKAVDTTKAVKTEAEDADTTKADTSSPIATSETAAQTSNLTEPESLTAPVQATGITTDEQDGQPVAAAVASKPSEEEDAQPQSPQEPLTNAQPTADSASTLTEEEKPTLEQQMRNINRLINANSSLGGDSNL